LFAIFNTYIIHHLHVHANTFVPLDSQSVSIRPLFYLDIEANLLGFPWRRHRARIETDCPGRSGADHLRLSIM
jgi:hypothetical protein